MWIMLTVKLGTRPSPPRLAIFWSVPWPEVEHAKYQTSRLRQSAEAGYSREDTRNLFLPDEQGGLVDPSIQEVTIGSWMSVSREHNWNGARAIFYKGEKIRVFPAEFKAMSNEFMKLFIEEGGLILHTDTVAEETAKAEVLDGVKRQIFEEALVDGCNNDQAQLVANGVDITLPNPDIPPLGWYEMKPSIAATFCHPHEMEETDPPDEVEKAKEAGNKALKRVRKIKKLKETSPLRGVAQ